MGLVTLIKILWQTHGIVERSSSAMMWLDAINRSNFLALIGRPLDNPPTIVTVEKALNVITTFQSSAVILSYPYSSLSRQGAYHHSNISPMLLLLIWKTLMVVISSSKVEFLWNFKGHSNENRLSIRAGLMHMR